MECDSLTYKKEIFRIAKSIIDKQDNEQIWNLHDIDTTDYFMTEDFFTSPNKKERVVVIGGNAGLSSGSADKLLILLTSSDTFKIVWAGQTGDFNLSDIEDFNQDGIKEIVCKSSSIWMGECKDNFSIFNFKDGRQNFIFTSHSTSVLDCGLDNLGDIFEQGDTLEQKNDCSILKNNEGVFYVKQIKTTKIHNGGVADNEIMKNLKIIADTTYIRIL